MDREKGCRKNDVACRTSGQMPLKEPGRSACRRFWRTLCLAARQAIFPAACLVFLSCLAGCGSLKRTAAVTQTAPAQTLMGQAAALSETEEMEGNGSETASAGLAAEEEGTSKTDDAERDEAGSAMRGSGELLYASEVPLLNEEQEQLILDYMNLYFSSLEDFEPQEEITSLFSDEEQAALADRYVDERNDAWPDYAGSGGNCQNFASQVLLAGGIPMDIYGDAVWKWYSDEVSNSPGAQGRSSSWTGVNEFVEYAAANSGYGLVAETEAPYFSGEPGDLLHMGIDGDWGHTVVIASVVTNAQGEVVDYLVDSNTGNLRSYPASLYGYPEIILTRIAGWNEG